MPKIIGKNDSKASKITILGDIINYFGGQFWLFNAAPTEKLQLLSFVFVRNLEILYPKTIVI